jgi:hypothetical protein
MTTPQTPMTSVPRGDQPPLDDRVIAHDGKCAGQPVARLTVRRDAYGGWFVVRRPKRHEDDGGVVLEIWIPGMRENRSFPDQAAAEAGADTIYAEYCQAVKNLAS